MVDLKNLPFVKAKHYTETGSAGRNIDLLVDHLMVVKETSEAAENVARYFAGGSVVASAHYNVDDNSIVQGVRDEDVAYAAPGGNSDGIQIEQAGTLQTKEQWADKYSLDMLENSCQLKAALAQKHGIPVRWLTAADLKANKRGITDHWQVTQAFGLSTHTDCGENYPRKTVIAITLEFVDHDHNNHAKPDKPDLPTIRFGDTTWLVKKAQKHLKRHGYFLNLPLGLHFDARTEHAIVKFQRDNDLKSDGVIGTKTWRKLLG